METIPVVDMQAEGKFFLECALCSAVDAYLKPTVLPLLDRPVICISLLVMMFTYVCLATLRSAHSVLFVLGTTFRAKFGMCSQIYLTTGPFS